MVSLFRRGQAHEDLLQISDNPRREDPPLCGTQKVVTLLTLPWGKLG